MTTTSESPQAELPDDKKLDKNYIVWLALFIVPSLYYLARLTPYSWQISFGLHWVMASLVLIWASKRLNGPKEIGLKHLPQMFLGFVVAVVLLGSFLIIAYKKQPLAGWQWGQIGKYGRWSVIFIAISAGFCEEVIYRGYMMTALKKAGQPVIVAMVLSSLAFVLFHGILPLPFMVPAFLLGMLAAFIYHKTSNLWIVIFAHGLWDTLVLLYPMR